MILTVTPNLALDVTYEVDFVVPGESHRVLSTRSRAGGKGVNVARTLGGDVLVTGFAGGATGDLVRADLAAADLTYDLVPCTGETRRTLTLVAQGVATVFNEPGPKVSDAEWTALERLVVKIVGVDRRSQRPSISPDNLHGSAPDNLHGSEAEARTGSASGVRAVVISGSLPAEAEPVHCARLAQAANGVPVIVDTSGPALLAAAPHASILKPNVTELAEATGRQDPLHGAGDLLTAGAGAVVVSLGEAGLLVVTNDGVWQAEAPTITPVNPTGAGDAVVAALARTTTAPWPDRLREAVALSAATVLAPVAGAYDPAAYRRFLQTVNVRQL
jgi:tagatose 6-phosphate kinase